MHKRPFYLGAGGITTRVQDTPATMRCLTAKQQAILCGMCIDTGLCPVKLHAHRDEPAYGCGRLFCQDTHGCLVTQAGPGSDGILEMQFGAIVSA